DDERLCVVGCYARAGGGSQTDCGDGLPGVALTADYLCRLHAPFDHPARRAGHRGQCYGGVAVVAEALAGDERGIGPAAFRTGVLGEPVIRRRRIIIAAPE